MNRREFLSTALGAGAASATSSEKTVQEASAEPEEIHPYFLESGSLTGREQEQIEDYILLQQEAAGGGMVTTRDRGGDKPVTFRFIHWNKIDQSWIWPNQIQTDLVAERYQVNAQILGFRVNRKVWGKDKAEGNLTFELSGENPIDDTANTSTSLYSRPFDVFEGEANVRLEYLAEQDIISHGPEIKLRMQLFRLQKQGGFLKSVFQVATALAGGVAAGPVGALLSQIPALRIPHMTPEAVNFAQGVFGASADKKAKPIWASPFMTYSLSDEASLFKLKKGLWVAIDEEPEDLTGIRLDDSQGKYVLRDAGNAPVDANYLVLDFQIDQAP